MWNKFFRILFHKYKFIKKIPNTSRDDTEITSLSQQYKVFEYFMYSHTRFPNEWERKEKSFCILVFVISMNWAIEDRPGQSRTMIACYLYNVHTITLRCDNKRSFKIERLWYVAGQSFMHYNVPFHAGSITVLV